MLQFGGGTIGHPMGIARRRDREPRRGRGDDPGAQRGPRLLRGGPDILEKAAKGCPELNAALQVWKDVTFDFESTDTPDVRRSPRRSAEPGRSTSMRITQGTFSFLPDLTDEQIAAQIRYALDHGWAIVGRVHRRPAPAQLATGRCGGCRCSTLPTRRAASCARSRACREAHPDHYVKVIAYDATYGPADDRAQLHRQPAGRRARLPARPAARRATADPVHAASLRGRPAGGRAVRQHDRQPG